MSRDVTLCHVTYELKKVTKKYYLFFSYLILSALRTYMRSHYVRIESLNILCGDFFAMLSPPFSSRFLALDPLTI